MTPDNAARAKGRVRRDEDDDPWWRECGRRLGTLRCEAPAGHGGRHYDGEAGVFWPGREDVQR
jgi:hypothetical protein